MFVIAINNRIKSACPAWRSHADPSILAQFILWGMRIMFLMVASPVIVVKLIPDPACEAFPSNQESAARKISSPSADEDCRPSSQAHTLDLMRFLILYPLLHLLIFCRVCCPESFRCMQSRVSITQSSCGYASLLNDDYKLNITYKGRVCACAGGCDHNNNESCLSPFAQPQSFLPSAC